MTRGESHTGSKRLKIDLDELRFAMEHSSYEVQYYLDLLEGDILQLAYGLDDDEMKKAQEQVEAEPERYEPVPDADPHKSYRDMEEFIATVQSTHTAELLAVAIQGKGAFGRFEDTLARFPEERERWFQFKNGRLDKRALEWLEELGIEPA